MCGCKKRPAGRSEGIHSPESGLPAGWRTRGLLKQGMRKIEGEAKGRQGGEMGAELGKGKRWQTLLVDLGNGHQNGSAPRTIPVTDLSQA